RCETAAEALAEPHREPPAVCALEVLGPAQPAQSFVRQPILAEVGRERLRDDDPATRVQRRPVAMKGHFDAPVGAEHRRCLPGNVREEAGGKSKARHLRAIIEKRSNPVIEKVAVLTEAML